MLKDDLIKWLDKTGYPLELQTEKILSRNDFSVFNSQPFIDDKESVKREIDLLAELHFHREEVSATINLLVECKKSDKPFVLMRKREDITVRHSLVTNYYSDDIMCHSVMGDREGKYDLDLPQPFGTGFKLVQGFINSDETVHKAGFGLSKAFYYYVEMVTKYIDGYSEDNTHSLHIPVLVISAPFFEASIGSNSELQLKEIKSGIWDSHIITSKPDEFSVVIVHIDALQDFLISIKDVGETWISSLDSQPQYQIKNILKKLKRKKVKKK